MTSFRYVKLLVFLLGITSLTLPGCDPGPNSASPSSDSDVSTQNKDAGFIKPSQNYERRSLFENEISTNQMPVEKGVLSTSQGREHMHSTEKQTAHWLYEGEHFVLDARHGLFGVEEPQNMTMVVLVDFEPQPFRLIPVNSPEEYPTLEEIRASSEPYEKKVGYQLMPGKHFNYTLVLPPESFGNAGAHDLRIVHLRKFAPSDVERLRFDGYGKSRAMTVYYGGNEFEQMPNESSNVSRVAPPNETVRDLLYSLHGVVITPSREVYNLDALEHPGEAKFAQVFESSKESIELTAFAAGADLPNKGGRNYYMLFNDAVPLVEQGKLVTTKGLPDDVNFEEPLVSKFSFEGSLADEKVHSFVLMQFPEPFEKLDEYPHPISSSVRSEVLFFQRTSSTGN